MTDPVKRMNYYDHQFLRAPDFQAEQNYNLSLRRRHNRTLHTWGIVEGLQVAAKQGGIGTVVTVGEGFALDNIGQEMVLPADKDLELSGETAGTTLYITIAYGEQPSDPTTEAGGPGNTRITESPNVTFSRNPPPPAETGKTLILATVQRVANGLGTINLSDRRQAGAVVGSNITVDTVTLRNGGVPQANWPALSCSAANLAAVTNGGLTINKDLTVGGNVGIGVTTATQKLIVGGGGAGAQGAGIGFAGPGLNASDKKLYAPADGDLEWMTQSGAGAHGFAVSNNGTKAVYLSTSGNSYLNGGNVGIGTATPGAKLQVAGSALLDGGNLALADTAGQTATRLLSYANADSLWVLQATKQTLVLADALAWDRSVVIQYTAGTTGAAAGALQIGQLLKNGATYTHGYTALFTNGVERMRINAAGNVGIGTATPVAKLHVHGNYSNDGSGGILLDATDSGNPEQYSLRINPFGIASAQVGYQFQTKSQTGGTQIPLTFDHAGNVGIGTTSPREKLQVAGSAVLDGGGIFIADIAGQTATRLRSYSNADSLWMIQPTKQQFVLADSVDWDRGVAIQYTPGTTGAAAGGLHIGQILKNSATYTHGYTALFTNGAERMRINAAGNVGIGTTAPSGALLHVGAPNVNASLRIGPVNWRGTAADTKTLGLERSRNQILFSTWRDQTVDKIGAKIVGINKQTYGAANGADLIQSTDLVFFTVPPGQMNNYDDTVERMRIMDTGIVHIGGMSGGVMVGPWPANPAAYVCFGTNQLDQADQGNYALLQGSGAETGRTFLNSPTSIGFRIKNSERMTLLNNGDFQVFAGAIKPNGGAWAAPSDRALKKEIAPIEGALEKILQLRGVSFAWREPEKHNATDRRYMGMVAQDVEPVFPEWVKPMQDGHKALEPIGFEGLVVEAIRQLSDRCERLEAELAQLRAPAGERDVVAPLRKAG